MNDVLSIFTISLEGSLFAFQFELSTGTIHPLFNSKDHIGRIKALHATDDGLILTSGEDENIRLYNYHRKKKLSSVFGLNGVCTRICSTKDYLVTCHENGQVGIVGKKDFAVYHRIKAFKESCIDIDIHPSNTLLVCLNAMGRFSVWNLADCAMIFHRKIKVPAEYIRFLNDENMLILTRNTIYSFNLKTMAITNEIVVPDKTKINDCVVYRGDKKNFTVVACENGMIYFYTENNFEENESEDEFPNNYICFKAYEYRVKRVSVVENYLVSVSTEGDISIWDINEIVNNDDIKGAVLIDAYSAVYEYKMDSRLIGVECVFYKKKEDQPKADTEPVTEKTKEVKAKPVKETKPVKAKDKVDKQKKNRFVKQKKIGKKKGNKKQTN